MSVREQVTINTFIIFTCNVSEAQYVAQRAADPLARFTSQVFTQFTRTILLI